MSVRRRERTSPWLAGLVLAAAVTSPFWALILASTITTRGRAVAVALTLPALTVATLIGASVFLVRHTEDSARRDQVMHLRAGCEKLLLVYVLVIVPLVLFGIAAQRGQP